MLCVKQKVVYYIQGGEVRIVEVWDSKVIQTTGIAFVCGFHFAIDTYFVLFCLEQGKDCSESDMFLVF
jgi:hypothetical protein